MQIDVLLLFLGLLLHEQAGVPRPPLFDSGGAMLIVSLVPYLLPIMAIALHCRRVRRLMLHQPQRVPRALVRLQQAMTLWRWFAVGIFLASIFGFGWMTYLEQRLGFKFLVPDLLALAPPLLIGVFSWWAYYPIHRKLQEASLIRQLDEGRPVYPPQPRNAFVISQIRHQMLLILLPMLFILTWVQLVHHAATRWPFIAAYEAACTAIGGIVVFLASPFILRAIWDVIPMPPGELRTRLLDLCESHRVKIRQLLLWRTHTGMVNGAVMGVVAPLRMILLTDGLIAQLPQPQVEAVMAHELGHVRRHHLPLLAVAALGTIGAMLSLLDLLMRLIEKIAAQPGWREAAQTAGLQSDSITQSVVGAALIAATFIAWLILFGWISRRFERQADTFAVQHFCADVITPDAAQTMADALRNVCVLNHASTTRPSWRHGSIEWRIAYLHSLVGRRADDCPIDKLMRRINLICLVLLIVSLASGAAV
ncbi:MAG: M48 family metallopeptidase [Phycisphaeraceae bacterium]